MQVGSYHDARDAKCNLYYAAVYVWPAATITAYASRSLAIWIVTLVGWLAGRLVAWAYRSSLAVYVRGHRLCDVVRAPYSCTVCTCTVIILIMMLHSTRVYVMAGLHYTNCQNSHNITYHNQWTKLSHGNCIDFSFKKRVSKYKISTLSDFYLHIDTLISKIKIYMHTFLNKKIGWFLKYNVGHNQVVWKRGLENHHKYILCMN